jgi:uncharacterized coiled-coil protein SlyX
LERELPRAKGLAPVWPSQRPSSFLAQRETRLIRKTAKEFCDRHRIPCSDIVLSLAGSAVTTGSNIIAIGAFQTGVDSDLGELDNSCYISNIAFQPVSAANFVRVVGVDSDGKLGTFAMDANGTKVPFSSLMDAQKQAVSNRKIEELQATVARQQKQIDALSAGLQKVSAQLEVSKPAPQVVTNKP